MFLRTRVPLVFLRTRVPFRCCLAHGQMVLGADFGIFGSTLCGSQTEPASTLRRHMYPDWPGSPKRGPLSDGTLLEVQKVA